MVPVRVPCDATFVQQARGLRFSGSRLTLLDLAPSTVFMTDRDGPTVGHVTTGDFLDLWLDGRGSSGVLSLLDAGTRRTGDAVLALSRPRIVAAGLEYSAHLERGTLPEASGACVLFINPTGTPVTPASSWQATTAPAR